MRPARARRVPLLLLVASLAACAELPAVPEGGADGGPSPPAPASDAGKATPTPIPPAAVPFPPGVLYKLLVAEFAGRRGNPQLAADNYLAVARATRDVQVAERATRIAVFARDQSKSLEAAALWVELAPRDLDALRADATLLLRAGRIDDAVAKLELIADQWTEPAGRGINLVSDLLARARDRERALAVMQRLVDRRPEDAMTRLALARLTTRFGMPDRSRKVLERALELDPTDAALVIFYARLLRSQKKTEEALKFLGDSLESRPDAKDVRMTYARLLVDAKRYDEARDQFQRLVEARPDDENVRFALGLLLLQTGDRVAARTEFEYLLALGKRQLAAHYYLGQIAEADEDDAAALAAYRQVDGGDHYLNAQIRIASIFAKEGALEKARAHLQDVRRDSPADDIRVFRAEAELLVEAEQSDEAIRVYDEALERYPKDGDLLYARAMVAARADRIDILERDLRDILSREPDNADALNALGYTLADRTDRYDEAMQLVKRALELKPNDHYILDSMGWVLYRLGRYEEAVAKLRDAMSISEDAEIAAHLGEVLWVLGQRQEARKVWESALEQKPDDERLLETIKRFSQ